MKKATVLVSALFTTEDMRLFKCRLYIRRQPAKAHKMHLMMGTNGIGKLLRHTQSLF